MATEHDHLVQAIRHIARAEEMVAEQRSLIDRMAEHGLNPVQNFIALVDSRSNLLLARKAHRVVKVADDPPILEMQLRREIKLNRHAAETPGCTRSSREKSPTLEEHPWGGL